MKKKLIIMATLAIVATTSAIYAYSASNKSSCNGSCCGKDTCEMACSCDDTCSGDNCECGCDCCK